MVIDGRAIAAKRLEQLRLKIARLEVKPKLVAILVGDDLASRTYVNLKRKRAEEVGIISEIIGYERETKAEEIRKRIRELNGDESVAGILVQLPLPVGMDTDEVLATIEPKKDVDGLTGKSKFLPAAVKAILTILGEVGVNPKDKRVAVVGQGKLVGGPLADVLEKMDARVDRCDENTKELSALTRRADILVSATGVPDLVTVGMVKPGAVVIDCGAPEAEVDFEGVSKLARFITPVPGGVGPVTVVSLLENTLEAALSHRGDVL